MRARTYLIAGAATVLLAAGSVAALAATGNGPTGTSPGVNGAAGAVAGCSVPSLPGQQVQVMLADMGGGGPMMGGAGPMRGGRMMLRAAPQTVHSGTVSFLAVNRGVRVHEMVVLPLAAGETMGTRPVGSDDTVDEAGSLGEASNSCGDGSGDGIQPGQAGWVTLTLQPGRYELICNLPGHYAAGMFAELDVT